MFEVALALLSLLAATMIALYATWLYRYRLRSGASKGLSFREWVKNLSDAILGL